MANKIKIPNNTFICPMVLIGSVVDDKVNYMSLGWISRVNAVPPQIAVAMNKRHYTNKGIHEHSEFGISVPSRSLMTKTDYCGLVSGSRVDKSDIFTTFFGELEYAPLIEECAVNIECRVTQVVDLPSNELFIAEIVNSYSEEQYLTDGKPDIKKIDPFFLSMPDNNYWALGENVGKAWSVGKELLRP